MFDIRSIIICFLSLFIVAGGFIANIKFSLVKAEAEECRAKVDEQNTAIEDMQTRAAQALLKQKERERKAEKMARAGQKEADAIMAKPVSKECGAAIKWGIDEAGQ